MIGGVRFEQPSSFVVTIGDIENRGGKRLARWTDSFSIYHAEHNEKGEMFRRAVEVEKDLVRRGFGRFLDQKETNWRLERVPIILQFNSVELNFHTYYALFGGSQCWCRCDNFDPNSTENCARRRNTGVENGRKVALEGFSDVPCPCDKLNSGRDGDKNPCFAYGRLSFQIQGWETLGSAAFFRTKSYHTINRFLTALTTMNLQLRGHVAGVPLQLVVKVVWKAPKKFPVVELMSQPLAGKSFLQVLQEAMQVPAIDSTPESRAALKAMTQGSLLALPAGPDMDDEDAVVASRFIDPQAGVDDDVQDADFVDQESGFTLDAEGFDPIEVRRAELMEADYPPDKIESYLAEYKAKLAAGTTGRRVK